MFPKWLATVAVVAFIVSIASAVFYDVFRRPQWPSSLGNVRIPGAVWIIVAILIVVLIGLAFLISRDPLQGPY
jgi:hypothetical protein